MRNTFLSLLASATLLATGALAQHEGHHPDETAPQADNAAPPVKGQMMGKMMPMMAEHAEVAKLVDQLAKSLAVMENEKDPAALKAELAEHGKLLKELQAKLQGQAQMMERMQGMMAGEHAKQ